MIKAILFDLDNTLIDFIKMKKHASNAAAKAMVKAGLKMSIAKAQKELYNLYITDIESNDIFSRFLRKHNIVSDKILASGINAYLTTKQKYLKTYPEVKSTLIKIKRKGIKIGVLTNAPRLKAMMRLDAIGLSKVFNVIIAYEDTGHYKPSKIPFKVALKKLKVDAKDCLMVGDWLECDIKGAKSVGMQTCFARYGNPNYTNKLIKTNYTIGRFKDLLRIVK